MPPPVHHVRSARSIGTLAVLAMVIALLVAAALPATAAKSKRKQASTTTTTAKGTAAGCGASSGRARAASTAPTAPTGPSAEAVVAQEPGRGQVGVELVRYPRPSSEGGPWSQWGQGLVLPDGRFLSAMGNHLGKDGNSWLFVYDPSTRTITRFADVLSEAGDATDWGYGKIHSQIVPGPCGEAYFTTYWGTRTGLKYTPRYPGDLVFRIDESTLALTSLGALVPERGIPSLAGSPNGDAVFGEAVDPAGNANGGHERGTFFVLDPRTGKVVFADDVPEHMGFRNVMTTPNGHAYIAAEGGRLLEYVPGADALRPYSQRIPGGGVLRASTAPTRDGTVYFATQNPHRFFAFRPDGTIETIGDAEGYTASMAVEPDGSAFYSVPAAHGDQPELNTPLVAVDPRTGQSRTVVELAPLVRRALRLETAGSYSVSLDAERRRLYVGLNSGPTKDDPWGEVVLAIIELP